MNSKSIECFISDELYSICEKEKVKSIEVYTCNKWGEVTFIPDSDGYYLYTIVPEKGYWQRYANGGGESNDSYIITVQEHNKNLVGRWKPVEDESILNKAIEDREEAYRKGYIKEQIKIKIQIFKSTNYFVTAGKIVAFLLIGSGLLINSTLTICLIVLGISFPLLVFFIREILRDDKKMVV